MCQKMKATKSKYMHMETTLLTQRKLAHALGVCVVTVRRWKECPRVAISKGRHRYDLAAVRAWLESRNLKGGEA